ncbi:MAG TPA: nuclear transport factor 2 family protein [Actinomycetales bacterium]|nr:nuclear transport factor 2 family protein [Actinomycetales bacterium]
MYKRIVEHVVLRTWQALDRRDTKPVLRGFARRFLYENVGADHAFGGTFRTREEVSAHFDLLFRLLPAVEFSVRDVLVSGCPHSTAVVVRVGIVAPLPDGSMYANELVQQLRLRWGKVTSVRALVDNVRAHDACERIAAAGVLTRAAA